MAVCSKCGKINYEGVKVCTACGSDLPTNRSSYSEPDEDNNQLQGDEEYDINEEEQASAQPSINQSESPKSNNTKLILIGSGILLVVIILLLLFWPGCGSDKGSSGEVKIIVPQMSGDIYAGDTVQFIDKSGGETSYWQFGDMGMESNEPASSYVYSAAGQYWVKLTVDGRYTDSVLINILPKVVLDAEEENEIEYEIIGPKSVKSGQSAVFEDPTPDVTETQWTLWDGSFQKVKGNQLRVTFPEDAVGPNQITVVNNFGKRMIIDFEVKRSKPAPPPPAGDEEEGPVELPELNSKIQAELQKFITLQDNDDAISKVESDFQRNYLASNKKAKVIAFKGEIIGLGTFINKLTFASSSDVVIVNSVTGSRWKKSKKLIEIKKINVSVKSK